MMAAFLLNTFEYNIWSTAIRSYCVLRIVYNWTIITSTWYHQTSHHNMKLDDFQMIKKMELKSLIAMDKHSDIFDDAIVFYINI